MGGGWSNRLVWTNFKQWLGIRVGLGFICFMAYQPFMDYLMLKFYTNNLHSVFLSNTDHFQTDLFESYIAYSVMVNKLD